jgi:hypothetical protein
VLLCLVLDILAVVIVKGQQEASSAYLQRVPGSLAVRCYASVLKILGSRPVFFHMLSPVLEL